MIHRIFSLILILSVFAGCSKKRIDSRYEGVFLEVNGKGRFMVNGNRGNCDVAPQVSGSVMVGECSIEGNKLTFTVQPNTGWPQDNYPEFKDGFEILRIDGDSFITSIDRRFVKAVVGKSGNLVLPSPSPAGISSPAPGGGRDLSNSAAESALNQWGMCADRVKVQGIQELPQQSAARAILQFSNCQLSGGHSMFGGKSRSYSGPGEAVFIKFNDGTWVLSKVQTSEGMDSVHWDDLNVRVR